MFASQEKLDDFLAKMNWMIFEDTIKTNLSKNTKPEQIIAVGEIWKIM